ncbi:MAG: transposase [candidate division Zixibacteria bacterium]|nr:transposase [candidate division Zixibacteria bacterium]
MVVRKRLKIKGPAIAFVTTTVVDWLPVLTKEEVAKIIISDLKKCMDTNNVFLVSYVIMPSHFHGLFGFRAIENLSKFMHCFKGISSKRIKALNLVELKPGNFRLWKPRFDDLIISSPNQLKIKMEYIHNNPVKSGLVKRATDWIYSSAGDWLSNKEGLIKIDKDFTWHGV